MLQYLLCIWTPPVAQAVLVIRYNTECYHENLNNLTPEDVNTVAGRPFSLNGDASNRQSWPIDFDKMQIKSSRAANPTIRKPLLCQVA